MHEVCYYAALVAHGCCALGPLSHPPARAEACHCVLLGCQRWALLPMARRLSPCWQDGPNRVPPVPVVCSRGDPCKDSIPPVTHVEQLDNGARVAFGQQIDKATAAPDTSRMANGIAHREQPCEIGLEIPWPIAEVLQTLVPGMEKIPDSPGFSGKISTC